MWSDTICGQLCEIAPSRNIRSPAMYILFPWSPLILSVTFEGEGGCTFGNYSWTSPHRHLYNTSLLGTVITWPERDQLHNYYSLYLCNTDTSVIRILSFVPLVSVLKRFDCAGNVPTLTLLSGRHCFGREGLFLKFYTVYLEEYFLWLLFGHWADINLCQLTLWHGQSSIHQVWIYCR